MVSVSEGDSVTITCTATGVPVPSVNWSRADGSSLTDSRYVISDTSPPMVVNEVYQVTRNLTIMNIVRADIGVEYGCTVTNVVDTVQSNVSIIVLCKLIIMYYSDLAMCPNMLHSVSIMYCILISSDNSITIC